MQQPACREPGTPRRGLAVFGSSEPPPGAPLYELAREVGRLAALRGLPVITGGYGGVMDGAGAGAREAGGESIGVTCRLFRGREPSAHLDLEIEEPDLFLRTRKLTELAAGFVVLGGRAGTLAELSMLWALLRAGALAAPVVLLDGLWERLYDQLRREGALDRPCVRWTRIARDAGDAVALAAGVDQDELEG